MLARIFHFTIDKIMLGRWNCTNEKLNKIKSHLANIDHCGTCSLRNVKPLVKDLELPLKRSPEAPRQLSKTN